ncbi:Na+/H+ antiporter subunit A [Nakamurella lactea]|uniref:Na+/H+ antiporter subunit A n=1 Tax=Nakamurella lactea TaxID=459515 RepID=UPI001FDEF1AA|nr:Na+/H+ antiporter subunit A [Nakamurella lactea]
MTDLFGLAVPILALYMVIATVAPTLARRWDRTALLWLALLPAATTGWMAALLPSVLDGGTRSVHVAWVPELSLAIDLRLDALSAVMVLVISAIGTLVLLYSARYFPLGDDGRAKYAGSLVAFAGAMIALVLADNLILLVVMWEITGILSYLLIAHRIGNQPARAAATQALITTTGGGLVMLIGAVMMGEQAGTYDLSQILAAPPSGGTTTAALVLLLVGGLSKSAIIPFQFWLPGAMAAPTPASAYLHAATMVKAGIYLFARLAPAFAANGVWQPLLIGLGAATMLFGAVNALRQRDLKLLLAYGTVSQLGLLTLLIGAGNPDALLAGIAMLVAHATFKGALFFVVGIIDTAAGTRDLTKLSGVGRQRPALAVAAALAAASMAGVPPMIGFVAKEAGYAGLLAGGTAGTVAAVLMTIGSALTMAYTLRFLWGAFADKPGIERTQLSRSSSWMTAPTWILVGAGLALALWPAPLESLLQSYAQTAGPTHQHALALWHGLTAPLGLSALGWIAGAALSAAQRHLDRRRGPAVPGLDPGVGYRLAVLALETTAARVTVATQRGSVPVSLGAVLIAFVVFPATMLLRSGAGIGETAAVHPAELVLAVVILALVVSILRARRAIIAILLVGGIGYAVAVIYILRGAPDLALTQILMESVTLVAALLVLTRLPGGAAADRESRPLLGRWVSAAIAIGVGALMTSLALILPGIRTATVVSAGMDEAAVTYGGGENLVNVILVDVRSWDTFGEISVLVAAATGVAGLIFQSRRTGAAPRTPRRASGLQRPNRPSPWLTTNWMPRRSLLLEVATRLIFPIVVMFSVYVLFVGHNLPGGGFAAGLIVGLALTLRYIAGGPFELGEAAPVDAGALMGTGMLISSATAIGGLIGGGQALQSVIFHWHVPVLGDLEFITSTIFDVGVYLIVIGLVLDVLHSFGAELDRQAWAARRATDDRAQRRKELSR